MSKKIIVLFAAVLMVFAFAGSKAVAAIDPLKEAATVYLELTKQTTSPYDPSPIRGRASFITAAGILATEFNGKPIGDSVLVISSVTFGDDVNVSGDSFTTPAAALTFSPAPLTLDLISPWQEFAVNYNDIPEIGSDKIRATLKNGTVTLASELPVVVNGPEANVYVVRSGGIAVTSLPQVLDPIPNPQADKGLTRRAGDNVPIDVFAAYGVDTDNDGDVDEFIFTDNVPAGAENVSISGGASASVVLDKGYAATTIKVTSLGLASTLSGITDAAGQLAAINSAFVSGKTFTWSASSTIIPEIGTECGDVNADDQLNLCGQNTFGNIANLTLDGAVSSSFNKDTSLFFPDLIAQVNMVGLPVTSVANTGATEGFLASGVSPLDAIYYLVDWTNKQNSFKVNGDGSGDLVYGALVGFDAYKNPAPFSTNTGLNVGFSMLTSIGGAIVPAPISAVGPWSAYGAGVLSGGANTFFLPFVAAANVNSLYVNSADMPLATISTIDSLAEGVSYAIENNVVAMPTSPPFPTVNTEAGGDSITIGVTGTSGENSFTLRVVKQTGTVMKVNTDKSTAPTADNTVSIPLKKASDNTAEQKVVFFTTASDVQLHYIFQGDSKRTIFAYKSAPARVSPADPGDFPPSAVSSSITKAGAILDTDHDEVNNCTFGVTDAFGNSFKFTAGGTTLSTIEDSDATVAVFKADGTTPFPGADAEIDDNNVVAQFTADSLAAGEGTAIVKVSAGDKSAQLAINVRALQKTVVAAQFVPILGVNDTPVMLNFGDQDGKMVSPVILKTCAPGSFEVDIETKDGSLTGIGETVALTTFDPFAVFTAKPDTGKTSMTITADGGDADATTEILTLDFIADFEPPVIGALTAGACSFTIACTDNKALNLTGSVVVVKKSSGEDITSTLTRTDTGNGTTSGTIEFSGLPGVDNYSANIVLKDQANNKTVSDRNVNVTTCEISCDNVDPNRGNTGATLDVVITGIGTHFGAASVVTFGYDKIKVNSQNATSATSITANITIDAAAVVGTQSDVTVTTGAEVVTCSKGFTVGSAISEVKCTSVTPASVKAGDTNKDVVIKLEGIDLTGITDVTVAFGCTGVTVNSSTVTSATEITANISVAKTAQDCTGDVTITGLSDVGVVCKGAFKVEAVPCTITIDPATVQTGFLFPRTHTIKVTASEGCAFDATTTVEVSGQKVTIVGDPVISGNTVTVEIRTRPVILGGKGTTTLTVTTGSKLRPLRSP